jgi:hypothetical protein
MVVKKVFYSEKSSIPKSAEYLIRIIWGSLRAGYLKLSGVVE